MVRLESNYRSTRPILAAASHLIAHNTGRLGKTLRAGRNDADGEKVRVVSLWDSEEEARMVGERIEAAQRSGHKLAEIAILVRAGFQTRAFEERLITLGVPYRVVGGLKFYERPKSATPWPICGCWRSRPTTWPSSGSSTPRSAASAIPRCGGCMRSPAPRASRW